MLRNTLEILLAIIVVPIIYFAGCALLQLWGDGEKREDEGCLSKLVVVGAILAILTMLLTC